MQSRPNAWGAANTLRDMPACPSAPVPRLRVQCKSSQRGYHKLIRVLASRPRWPEGVASSPHPPHPSCKRGRVPPACLHTCVALSESDFWGILLYPRSVLPAMRCFPRSSALHHGELAHPCRLGTQHVLQVKASLLCDLISTNPAMPPPEHHVLCTHLVLSPLPPTQYHHP